jgi:hypothetical protein
MPATLDAIREDYFLKGRKSSTDLLSSWRVSPVGQGQEPRASRVGLVRLRAQNIALYRMRAAGARNMLIYCADHRCGQFRVAADDDADCWRDGKPRSCAGLGLFGRLFPK